MHNLQLEFILDWLLVFGPWDKSSARLRIRCVRRRRRSRVARILSGIHISLWEHPTAEQHRDLVGIDFVVLRVTAVDRFHIQGMPS